MRFIHIFLSVILIFTTPIYAFEMPHAQCLLSVKPIVETPTNYDDFLCLLAQIESGELEKYCNEKELDQINELLAFYARQGELPEEESFIVEQDIQELLACSDTYLAHCYGQWEAIPCKSWAKKQWKHTKHFCKKHKKALIIGAAVIVAVSVVTCIVIASASAATGAGAIGAAGGAIAGDGIKDSNTHNIDGSSEVTSAIESQVEIFKEKIVEEQFLETYDPSFPIEASGRILGDALARTALDELNYKCPSIHAIDGPGSIDHAFLSNGAAINSHHFNENVYQLRGSYALETGYYDQAICDLSKAIDLNPMSYNSYLDRSMAYLQKGNYIHSLQDYENYVEKKPASLENGVDFIHGFSKGLPQGAFDSGRQYGTFIKDVVIHPIDTSIEMGHALATLAKLTASQEWKTISETIAPEVIALVENWDNLSAYEKGEGTGYVFGKHGTDLLIPGAAAKLVSKGIPRAQELAEIGKNLKNAQKIFSVETIETQALKEICLGETIIAVQGIVIDVEKLTAAGKEFDRTGFTKAGRGLMKHGYRNESVFPKPLGNPAQINNQGQIILEEILNDPNRKVYQLSDGALKVYASNGRGAFFKKDGSFRGFIEQQHE